MHAGIKKRLGLCLLASVLVVMGTSGAIVRGDEPGLFGRLFRLGGGPSNAPTRNSAPPSSRESLPDVGAPAASPGLTAPSTGVPTPSLLPPGGGVTSTPMELDPASNAATQRIRPQPRVSRAATEADPLVTRLALGRSDDGKQFGMFLQVYADGTVIDGEGVHKLGPEAVAPIVRLLQTGELARVSGHCGGPPADFVEQVYVVVYERRLGGLRANSFSYSGNTAGCDASVRHLHQVLEQLQTRLMSPGTVADPATVTSTSDDPASSTTPVMSYGTTPPPPLYPTVTGSALQLTPNNP